MATPWAAALIGTGLAVVEVWIVVDVFIGWCLLSEMEIEMLNVIVNTNMNY